MTRFKKLERCIMLALAVLILALSALAALLVLITNVTYIIGSRDILSSIQLGSTSIWCLVPTLIATVLSITVLKSYTRPRFADITSKRRITSVILIVLAVGITILSKYPLFFIIASESETNDPADYMELDRWVQNIVDEDCPHLFPDEIPANAENVKYYYYADTPEMSVEYFEIYAEWQADPQYIKTEAERIKSLPGYCGEFTLGSFTCITAAGKLPFHEELNGSNPMFFAYDPDTNTVRYVYYNAPWIEDLDDSYFYSLDW